MLIKINETGTIFNDAIEFIKENKNIKTSSKAAVEAILDYEYLMNEKRTLENMINRLRNENLELFEKVEKAKKCMMFLNSL
jgi:NTP pyrophosphatase (non-canonical NTP hydrolase)